MFCRNCGKYNPDSEVKCKYCGGALSPNEYYRKKGEMKSSGYGEDKTTVGVLMSLFLGLIGLVIGLLMYSGYERETFLKGWLKAFIVCLIIAIICVVALVGCYMDVLKDYAKYYR